MHRDAWASARPHLGGWPPVALDLLEESGVEPPVLRWGVRVKGMEGAVEAAWICDGASQCTIDPAGALSYATEAGAATLIEGIQSRPVLRALWNDVTMTPRLLGVVWWAP